MDLTLRLPGQSVAVDLALARAGAALGVQRLHGLLAAAALPAHANNPCDVAGCTYLGKEVIDGVTWLLYLCPSGVIEYYLE